jgi:hypothetical protein
MRKTVLRYFLHPPLPFPSSSSSFSLPNNHSKRFSMLSMMQRVKEQTLPVKSKKDKKRKEAKRR